LKEVGGKGFSSNPGRGHWDIRGIGTGGDEIIMGTNRKKQLKERWVIKVWQL